MGPSDFASKTLFCIFLQSYAVRDRTSGGLLIPDALIAATAVVNGMPLISKNQRDYRFIEYGFIERLDLLPYPDPFSALEQGSG